MKTLMSFVPFGRLETLMEWPKVVLFLASDDSGFVTGIELFVDGRTEEWHKSEEICYERTNVGTVLMA
jgi:NAD(P)-dependent dehydrogenase (short-subunit alcohol dehydrogenase family)